MDYNFHMIFPLITKQSTHFKAELDIRSGIQTTTDFAHNINTTTDKIM